ncbi:MAG: YoaK family protein, partial [Geminicoccales bacterium]
MRYAAGMAERSEARSQEPESRPTTARDVLLVLLAVAAGCVDAVSFLGLGQVLTAAMTGNTVLLGLALGQADAQAALRGGVALAGFVAGAVLGAAIVERGARAAIWSPAVTAALGLELVVLIVLALGWHLVGDEADRSVAELDALIASAGLAMGIQSAAAHRIGVPGAATTYVTGTLTSLAARSIEWLRSSRVS